MNFTIAMSAENMLRQIYAESAWRVAKQLTHGIAEPRLSNDSKNLVMVSLTEAFNSLCRKIMGYVSQYSSPAFEQSDIATIEMVIDQCPAQSQNGIANAAEQFVVAQTLWSIYGENAYEIRAHEHLCRLLNLLAK